MSTGNMPPFPTMDDSMIQQTPQEENAQKSGMALYSGLGKPGEFKDSYISSRLGELHKMHLDSARRHFSNIQNYYYTLDSGNNPATGQPLTDDERGQYQNMLEGAWDDMMKVPGLDKDAKAELQARRDMMGQVLTHGREKVAHTAVGLMPPPPGMEPPTMGQQPSPTDLDTSAAAPRTGGMPPPPQVLLGEMANPFVGTAVQSGASTTAELTKRRAEATAAGLVEGSPEWQYKMANGTLPPWSTASATYTNPKDGSTFTGRVTPSGVMDVFSEQIIPGATKTTAGQQAAPTLFEQNGIPVGVKRNGQTLLPGDGNFTPADQKFLDAGIAAHKQSQEEITKRQEQWQSTYAQMRGKVMQYQVMNLETGDPAYVNANEINANPNKYAPLGASQSLVNRDKVFSEINYTMGQLDKAIGALDETQDFSDEAKMKLAFALRETDPESAVSTLVNTGAMGTLSPTQLNYVAALLSATESAMSLRSIAGMGQGSDRLRGAISAMIPGAKTPSKAFAQHQMELVHGEVNALHQAIPPAIRNVGAGNMPTPLGGAAPAAEAQPPIPTTPLKAGNEWRYSKSRKKWAQGKEVNGTFTPDPGQ